MKCLNIQYDSPANSVIKACCAKPDSTANFARKRLSDPIYLSQLSKRTCLVCCQK